jgi:hypothetical protein
MLRYVSALRELVHSGPCTQQGNKRGSQITVGGQPEGYVLIEPSASTNKNGERVCYHAVRAAVSHWLIDYCDSDRAADS